MSDDARHATLVDAIEKLSHLTGENFHGYRSEVWGVLSLVFAAGQQSRTPGPVTEELCGMFESQVEWTPNAPGDRYESITIPFSLMRAFLREHPRKEQAPANRGEEAVNAGD